MSVPRRHDGCPTLTDAEAVKGPSPLPAITRQKKIPVMKGSRFTQKRKGFLEAMWVE